MTGGRPYTDSLIILTRDDGKRFWLPLEKCRTWQDAQVFFHNILRQYDVQGKLERDEFDIIGPDGAVIAPYVWPANLQAGSHIMLRLWKAPYDQPENTGPSAPQAQGGIPDKVQQGLDKVRGDLNETQNAVAEHGKALDELAENVDGLRDKVEQSATSTIQATPQPGQTYYGNPRALRFFAGQSPISGSSRAILNRNHGSC